MIKYIKCHGRDWRSESCVCNLTKTIDIIFISYTKLLIAHSETPSDESVTQICSISS